MEPHAFNAVSSRSTSAVKELPYVLVADSDQRRIETCLEAIKPLGFGVLVARNGDEAITVLRRFGPAALLFADVLLPPHDGFMVIEAARRLQHTRTGIVAWSAARALREFALCRSSGLNVRVVDGSARPEVIRNVIDSLLRARLEPTGGSTRDRDDTSDATYQVMKGLQARARDLCGTPGIAVYLREGAGHPFRSSGTWSPDEPMPHSLDYLPHALNRIMETREPFVVPDVAGDQSPIAGEQRAIGGLRGVAAVPVFGGEHGEIIGMICAFDVKPLTLEPGRIEALKALGRMGLAPHQGRAVAVTAIGRRRRPAAAFPADVSIRPGAHPVTLLDRDIGSAAVARELARVRREQNLLSVVLFDVNAGAEEGAQPSVAPAANSPVDALGHTVTRVIRGSDLAIRWSGRKLLLVLPGVGKTEADRVAERVRSAVRTRSGERFAIAGGVAELGADTFDAVLARADQNIREKDEPQVQSN